MIAPHCDDATLGCAGIIQEVLEAGGQVMVVAMTNGDGFTFAAKGQFHRLFINNFDYIQSGYTRQKELLRALNRLGMAEEKIVFMSYPDRGLRELWLEHWDSSTPYQSRYTGRDHSPYYNSYRPVTIYAGETVTPVATMKSVDVDLTEMNAWVGQETVLVHSKGVSSIGALERRA